MYLARKTFSEQLASLSLTTASAAGLFVAILAIVPNVTATRGAAPSLLVFDAAAPDNGNDEAPVPAAEPAPLRAEPPAARPAPATPPEIAPANAPAPIAMPTPIGAENAILAPGAIERIATPQFPAASPPSTADGAGRGAGREGTGERPAAGPAADPAPAHDAYGRIVFARVRARQHYARELAREGTSGTVTVEIRINGRGRIIGVSVAAPSGDATLDRLAVDQARGAGPFPAPPGGRARVFRLPMTYRPR
ncbi:MAG: energy transducer TonB family protein [Pseudomonadota bacterium]